MTKTTTPWGPATVVEAVTVAQRAGVSVGLLYRYFGSKAGLVAAVVDDFYDRLLAEVAAADDRELDWATRERRRTENSVAFHYREPLAPIILTLLTREPEVAETYIPVGIYPDERAALEAAQQRAMGRSPRIWTHASRARC